MKKTLLLLVAALATTTMWAADYITDVMVIGGSKSVTTNLKNKYTGQGWTFIDKDLNDGCGSGSDYIYLLYKTASETTTGATFITNFLVSTVTGTIPDSFQSSDRTYHLVSYDGSDFFKNNKGDLNSHAGGATIHLYYTKEYDRDGRDYATVKSITFNDTQDGGVTAVGESIGYDLNKGCGSGSDYIYMHAGKAPGWILSVNTAGTQCYVTGFEGPKSLFTSIIIPTAIDNATVLGLSNTTFSGFTNLESMTFPGSSSIDQMPSVQGCSNFKHVNTLSASDQTPPSMTRIPSSAFVGTAIEKITLDSVTYVGSDAFKGCSLTSVTFKKSPVLIEHDAFSEISKACQVSYPGSMEDWNPTMYMYSHPLVIHNGNSWYCGWCGGESPDEHNYLCWTMDSVGHMNIASYTEAWELSPNSQYISGHEIDADEYIYGWDKNQVKYLTLEHVAGIRDGQFKAFNNLISVNVKSNLKIIGKEAFKNCSNLRKIYLPSCLDTIKYGAIGEYEVLLDLYFDGSKTQWDSVAKEDEWFNGSSNDLKEHWHCMVTFDRNGHGTAPAAQYIQWSNEGKATEPTAPTATGYTFKGWYTEAACINQWDFTWTVPGDMKLYAKWESNLQRGDINGDGKVDVSDVNIIINIMLGKAQASSYPGNPDLNNDNKVDVTDVNAVINIMLGKE
ncbi:MAG: leucine-rich repeat protein [Muribaculaceae bacterium]|nr:leucine-rich repeat protein [Muribaculaceae bacterium]